MLSLSANPKLLSRPLFYLKPMKTLANRFPIFTLLLLLPTIILSAGCSTLRVSKPSEPPPQPINTIRIGNFQSDDAIEAQAVRNVFIQVLGARNCIVKVIRDGDADVVIEGTITHGVAGSSGRADSVYGTYVAGVTAVAMRNGDVLSSASWGQVMAKGKRILPPELVAWYAANKMVDSLYKKGLRKR